MAGATIATAPWLVPLPPGVVGALADLAAAVFGLGALSLLFGLATLLRGLKDRRAAARPAGFGGPPRAGAGANRATPDAGDAASARRAGGPGETPAGEQFDARLRVAAAMERAGGDERAAARASIRADLRELAVETHRRVHGVDRTAARRAIDRGDWCDDPVAAAFLGGDAGTTIPLRERLGGLFHPNGIVYHRVERTLEALRSLDAAGSATAATSPDEGAGERDEGAPGAEGPGSADRGSGWQDGESATDEVGGRDPERADGAVEDASAASYPASDPDGGERP